jgi:hypothetical protein
MEADMNGASNILASAAIAALLLTGGHAAEAPLPPRLNFVATPASQLHLGMNADAVARIMGKAARETEFAVDSVQIRKLEFTDAIAGQVILRDGKVSRVMLDAFRMEKGALPSFIRQAWPGLASSAVRRGLGEPAAVVHHTFFGIEVDQWIFSRPGASDVSVFFRDDRVIAKSVGRDVPGDLFRVDLPTRQTEGEGPSAGPRIAMTERDVRELHGAPRFRVDYVRNGQQASREVYELSSKETFVAFTFVDGIMTELEDIGRMPDAASFQGL